MIVSFDDDDDEDSDTGVATATRGSTRNKRSSSRMQQELDLSSDSDSDDSLLGTSASRSKVLERSKAKRQKKNDQFLATALRDATESTGRHLTVMQLQLEAEKEEEEQQKQKQQQEQLKLEAKVSPEKDDTNTFPVDQEEEEDLDRLRTGEWGTRPCINLAKSRAMPSLGHALACLSCLLSDQAQDFPPNMYIVLVKELHNNSLHTTLSRKSFRQLLDEEQPPCNFFHWLLSTACSQPKESTEEDNTKLESLAIGSVKLFGHLSSKNAGRCTFYIQDFPIMLHQFFGISLPGRKSSNSSLPSDAHPKKITSLAEMNLVQRTLQRFLQLWDIACRHNMVVHITDDKENKDATTALIMLLQLALDPCLENTQCHHRSTHGHLKSILQHFTRLARTQSGEASQSKPMEELFQQLKAELSPEDATAPPPPQTYLCLTRQVRYLTDALLTDHSVEAALDARELCLSCSDFLLPTLQLNPEWRQECEDVLKNDWGVPSELCLDVQGLAFCHVSLDRMLPRIDYDLENQCLALVELAVIWVRLSIRNLNLASSNNTSSAKDELAPVDPEGKKWLNLAMKDLERTCELLGKKSNSFVLGSSELRRLNVFVNSLRQYPRLLGGSQKFENPEQQTKLKIFFAAKASPEG